MDSHDAVKLLAKQLRQSYRDQVPAHVRLRYARMLSVRAAKFYIESNLDSGVVEEDLYRECGNCGEEIFFDSTSGKWSCAEGWGGKGCGKMTTTFPNIKYSEDGHKEYAANL